MRFFNFQLVPYVTGSQPAWLGPVLQAIYSLAKSLDNYIGGDFDSAVLQVKVTSVPSGLASNTLVYTSASGVVTTDYSKGYNSVYIGNSLVNYQGGIISGLGGLSPGAMYWLDLATGVITSTPNANSKLQLLRPAISVSDLHFTYSTPVSK